MKNKLTQNLGWKIVSLLASIVLWLVVTAISNPSVSQSFYNIPVQIKNTEMITNSGRVYKVIDNTNVIPKVTIKAPHSIISQISDKDIIATADVSEISSLDTVTIKLTTNAYFDQVDSIKGSIDTVKLDIENKKTKTLVLATNVTGSVGEGYMLGDVSMEQNLVRISGAESEVNSVTTASVDIDVTGFTTDIGTNAEIKFYDSQGRIISLENVTQNIKTVGVKLRVLQTKTVPVIINVSGDPAQGYSATGAMITDVDMITVAGASSAVKNLEAIEIPGTAVDISGQKGNYSTQINLKNYMPEGVMIVDSPASCNVTVEIEANTLKKISISEDVVEIRNLPEGYEASLSVNEGTAADFSGLRNEISTITVSSIHPYVDIAEWMGKQGITEIEDGFYNIPIGYQLPGSVRNTEQITALVHIMKLKTEE